MPTGPGPQSVTGPLLKRRPIPCTAAEQMTGWGTWARCALAASSCGVITVLAGCSAGTAATPTPTSPASVTSSADPQGGSAATISKPTGSAGAAGTVAPLTGLTVTAATAQRPAVAVAVAGSDPVGLGSADLVFEEITSPVRYLA